MAFLCVGCLFSLQSYVSTHFLRGKNHYKSLMKLFIIYELSMKILFYDETFFFPDGSGILQDNSTPLTVNKSLLNGLISIM